MAFDEAAFRQKATAAGFSEEKISAYIAEKTATSSVPEVVEPEIKPLAKPTVSFNKEGGYSFFPALPEDEVRQIASAIGVDPSTEDGINATYSQAQRQKNWQRSGQELLTDLQEFNNVARPFSAIKSTYNTAANAEYEQMKRQSIENILSMAADRGLQAEYRNGEFVAYDEQGNLQKITPSFLQSIGAEKFETVGAIAGAAAGLRAPVAHPLAKLVAAMAGGAAGAALGESVDYLASAVELQEELDAKVAAEKAMGAAAMDALLTGGIAAGGKVLSKLGAAGWNSAKHAFSLVKDGNTVGAHKALKDALGYITDEEAQEIVARWERLHQQKAPGKTTKEKAISILPRTTPGGETVVAAAAREDAKAAITLRADLNARAQTVLNFAKNPAETGANLRQALSDYTTSVRNAYAETKAAADFAPKGYEFNLVNKSLVPALEETIEEIADPSVVEKLQRTLIRIEQRTESRTFQDLLDLREALNEFKYANKITSKSKFVANEAVTAARNEVDQEIARVAKNTKEGQEWLKQWKDVNKEYGQYKMLQKNALFNFVTKKSKGINEKDIAKALVKYGPSIDDTYTDVMAKIPAKTRATVENEIIDVLTNKFASGETEGFKAVSFPDLAQELQLYKFNSPKAITLQKAAQKFAEVYKNDKLLFQMNPQLQHGAGQTIATTIEGKAKMQMVNSIWRRIKDIVGGSKADVNALINKTAEALENPLDAKAAKRVLDAIGEDEELKAAFTSLQKEMAKEAAEGNVGNKIKLYQKGTTTYTTPGSGRKEISSIPAHRMTSADTVENLLGREIKQSSDLSKTEKALLLNQGFVGLRLKDGTVLQLR